MYYLIGYRIKIVRKNLRNAFPDKSAQDLRSIEKQFYKDLCDYAVETVKLLTISKEDLAKRMVYKNPNLVKEYADNNQSIILLASHQFNWEWLLVSGCLYLPFNIDFVFQQQASGFFNQLTLDFRTRFGAYPVERSHVAREAIKRRNILRAIAVVADQFPGLHHDKKYWTKFLNQDTAFFQGLGQLALFTQYPAIFYGVKKIKRGYYEAEGVVVSRPPYEKESHQIVEEYVKATEKIINQYPSGWLWSHKRWKRTKSETEV